jgi:hypothetical protein
MGRRSRRRDQQTKEPVATSDYSDADGNVLTVRNSLSWGTRRELEKLRTTAAATQEDRYQRRGELLFERLVVGWTISGLPLEGQKELLGRYRMADSDTRRWLRDTLERHVAEHHPEAAM